MLRFLGAEKTKTQTCTSTVPILVSHGHRSLGPLFFFPSCCSPYVQLSGPPVFSGSPARLREKAQSFGRRNPSPPWEPSPGGKGTRRCCSISKWKLVPHLKSCCFSSVWPKYHFFLQKANVTSSSVSPPLVPEHF